MFLCCSYNAPGWSISDLSSVATIIIAGVNVFLAYYIFVYKRTKDKADKIEALTLQEQNIRLQWFKELVIQPHLADIYSFYAYLHRTENSFTATTPISEPEKIAIVDSIKEQQSKIRKSFVDVLRGVNPQIYNGVKNNLDKLIDDITTAIFNDNLKINDKATFDKEIGSLISYSRNDLISKIYNYKGD